MLASQLRRRLVLAALLISVTTLVWAAGQAAAAPPTRIVYSSGGRLIAATPRGTGRHLLARIPKNTLDIAASASGRHFALIANRALRVGRGGSVRTLYLYTVGRGLRRVKTYHASGPISVALSPDGRRLAFARGGEIWLLGADGRGARRVTSGPGRAAYPAFTPDGGSLVFTRSRGSATGIYRALLSGESETLVALGSFREPAVSAGGLVAYRAGDSNSRSQLLGTVPLGGGEEQVLARPRDPFSDGGPAFSPSGASLAFIAARETRSGNRYSIQVISTDGRNRRTVLRRLGAKAIGPLWTRVPAG